MKINVKDAGGKGFTIGLPNAMLFSPTLLNFGIRMGKRHAQDSMPDIPPETIRKLCRTIKDYSKKYGPWELVHVESASGDRVVITI